MWTFLCNLFKISISALIILFIIFMCSGGPFATLMGIVIGGLFLNSLWDNPEEEPKL